MELERFSFARVAADDRAAVFLGQRAHTDIDAIDVIDWRIAGGDEVDEDPAWACPHGGDVAEDPPQCLVSNELRVGIWKKMMAAYNGV